MITYHDIAGVPWRLDALDLIFLVSTVYALRYSVREWRTGRKTYLVLWLSAFAYGVLLEFTTGMLISRSYIQGRFVFNLHTSAIPGYKTDMPLYILVLYPTFIFLGFKLVESLGIQRIATRAAAAGVCMVLIDAPYVLYGNLAEVRWWTWLPWRFHGQQMFEYWHGWPLSDAFWEMTWPPLLMWFIWTWERREQGRIAANAPSTPLRTLVGVPVATAIGVNLGGFVATIPLSIAMAFGWRHYTVVLPVLVVQAAILLYSTKSLPGMDRAGWTLVGVHVLGYGVVTASLLHHGTTLASPLTLVLLSFAGMLLLAAYPARIRARTSPGTRAPVAHEPVSGSA